jgi:anti-sigma factor RsiW
MKCRRTRKDVQIFLDGDLRSGAEERLHSHLERCDGCRDYMEQMVSLRRAVEVRRLEGRDEAYWRSYWPRLRPKLAGKPARRTVGVVGLLKNPAFELAAVCAVVFVLMLRFNVFVFQSPVTEPVPGVLAPLRGPGAYRHVLGSSSRGPAVSDDRLDRVIDPTVNVRRRYVLAPARGLGVSDGAGTIAI